MSDTSISTNPSKGTPSSSQRVERKIPWLDMALVVGGVALVTIAILSQLGGLHSAYSLLHIGTISSHYVTYGLYAGTGSLLLIEAGKLIYQCLHAVKTGKPVAELQSPILQSDEKGAILHQVPRFSSKTIDVSEYTFELQGNPVILYLISPSEKKKEDIQHQIEQVFIAKNTTDVTELKVVLKDILAKTDYQAALIVGNNVIVSAQHALRVFTTPEKPGIAALRWGKGNRKNAVHALEGTGRDVLILGDKSTISRLSPEITASIMAQEQGKSSKAKASILAKKVKGGGEIALIVFNVKASQWLHRSVVT